MKGPLVDGRFRQRVAATVRMVAALLGVLVAPAAAHADVSHRDDVLGVTITLPGGWTPLTPEEIDTLNANAASIDVHAAMAAGFWSDTAESRGDVYVLFQSLQRGPLPSSYAEIARGFGAVDLSETEEKTRSLDLEVDFGRFILVPESNRLEMLAQMTCADGTVLVAKSYLFLCRDGISTMHCYARSDLFPEWGQTFQNIADSAVIAPGFAYVPTPVSAGPASPSVFLFVVVPSVVITLVVLGIMRALGRSRARARGVGAVPAAPSIGPTQIQKGVL